MSVTFQERSIQMQDAGISVVININSDEIDIADRDFIKHTIEIALAKYTVSVPRDDPGFKKLVGLSWFNKQKD